MFTDYSKLSNEELRALFEKERDYCNSMNGDDGNAYCYWIYHVEPIREELNKRGIDLQWNTLELKSN